MKGAVPVRKALIEVKKMNGPKTGLAGLVFISLLFLSGCWDRQELGEVALVMGLGVDLGKGKNRYTLSFQVVNPAQVAGGQTTGGNQTGSSVTTYSESGETLYETIREVSQKLSRRLVFSHTEVLIIGEQLAKKKGIQQIFDFTERYYKFRKTTKVLLARNNTARDVLSVSLPLEDIPAIRIGNSLMKTSQIWGENPVRTIHDVIQMLSSKGKQLTLSGIAVTGNENEGKSVKNKERIDLKANVEMKGLAIFQNGRLKGWVENETARGVLYVLDEVKSTVMTLPCHGKKEGIAVEIVRSKTNVQANTQKSIPRLTVNIFAEGSIAEVLCPLNLKDSKTIFRLERKLEKAIQKEVRNSVQKAKKMKSDIFGFGETVNRSDPKRWKALQKKWNETFTRVPVQIRVHAFIRRTGLRFAPFYSGTIPFLGRTLFFAKK